jgi:predicted phosphodiesterase
VLGKPAGGGAVGVGQNVFQSEELAAVHQLCPRGHAQHLFGAPESIRKREEEGWFVCDRDDEKVAVKRLLSDTNLPLYGVLGNHDMIVHGVNIGGGQKSKVIAYLLGDKIKILEDDKIILIKIDSNSQGSLARGAVGSRQLYEIEEELSTVDHLEDYTPVVLLHHHVYKVGKADFLKVAFKEKAILGKLLDSSKALIDAPIFISWLKRQRIRYVLHGHKHIPFFMKKDHAYIISAGSATGGGLKEEKSKYLSYNLLKYDYINNKMSVCFIFYIDRLKTNRSRVEIYIMEDEKHV